MKPTKNYNHHLHGLRILERGYLHKALSTYLISSWSKRVAPSIHSMGDGEF